MGYLGIRLVHSSESIVDDPETLKIPEDAIRVYNRLVRYLFRLYEKDPAQFDYHIHYDNNCTGQNDVQEKVYEVLASDGHHATTHENKSRELYVCFKKRIASQGLHLQEDNQESCFQPPSFPQQNQQEIGLDQTHDLDLARSLMSLKRNPQHRQPLHLHESYLPAAHQRETCTAAIPTIFASIPDSAALGQSPVSVAATISARPSPNDFREHPVEQRQYHLDDRMTAIQQETTLQACSQGGGQSFLIAESIEQNHTSHIDANSHGKSLDKQHPQGLQNFRTWMNVTRLKPEDLKADPLEKLKFYSRWAVTQPKRWKSVNSALTSLYLLRMHLKRTEGITLDKEQIFQLNKYAKWIVKNS